MQPNPFKRTSAAKNSVARSLAVPVCAASSGSTSFRFLALQFLEPLTVQVKSCLVGGYTGLQQFIQPGAFPFGIRGEVHPIDVCSELLRCLTCQWPQCRCHAVSKFNVSNVCAFLALSGHLVQSLRGRCVDHCRAHARFIGVTRFSVDHAFVCRYPVRCRSLRLRTECTGNSKRSYSGVNGGFEHASSSLKAQS